jgi:hypothetical protein
VLYGFLTVVVLIISRRHLRNAFEWIRGGHDAPPAPR